MRLRSSGGPWFWPSLLVVAGVVLLLDNFLLLGSFNAPALAPLLLIIAGAHILLRGDFVPDAEARRFGITRGNVESGTLEISSGEIDVEVRALQPDWRLRDGQHALIAGQYASGARPQLRMVDNYAHLRMDRSSTPWLSFADWKMGLAGDMPWQILVSTHLGQVNLDLSELIIHSAAVGTGLGDIRLVSPPEALGPLHIRSALGSIHVITPPGYRTRIVAQGGRMFGLHADELRYTSPQPNVYLANDADDNAPQVEIFISGTFGDAYFA